MPSALKDLPRCLVFAVSLLMALGASAAEADVAPAYSRNGFDYFSAHVEAPNTRSTPNSCEKHFGKHTEVRAVEDKGFVCAVVTASEPRLSAKLRDEIALVGDVSESRRQKMVDSLIEKHRRLVQCPSGTEAAYDGAMFFCEKAYTAKELCPNGATVSEGSEDIACVLSVCPKGFSDLGGLTGGKHPGCFMCSKGTWDAKETEAFHGSLKGMPADYTEVFCKVKSGG